MKTRVASLFVLVFVLLCLLSSAMAQDAASTQDAQSPVVVNIQPAPGNASSNTSDAAALPFWQIALTSVISLLVGGSLMFGVLGNRAKAVTQDPVSLSIAEKLGDSVPSAVVTPLLAALERTTAAFESITTLFKEATDKTPAASKSEAGAQSANGAPFPERTPKRED